MPPTSTDNTRTEQSERTGCNQNTSPPPLSLPRVLLSCHCPPFYYHSHERSQPPCRPPARPRARGAPLLNSDNQAATPLLRSVYTTMRLGLCAIYSPLPPAYYLPMYLLEAALRPLPPPLLPAPPCSPLLPAPETCPSRSAVCSPCPLLQRPAPPAHPLTSPPRPAPPHCHSRVTSARAGRIAAPAPAPPPAAARAESPLPFASPSLFLVILQRPLFLAIHNACPREDPIHQIRLMRATLVAAAVCL